MDISSDFILREISKVSKVQRKSRNQIMINCPFHFDTDPSLSISLGGKVPAGVFHCFSGKCGISGYWNTLAEKLGLATVVTQKKGEEDLSTYIPNVSKKIELFSPILEEDLSLEELDFNWRSFPIELLKSLGIKKLWEERIEDYFIYMPVTYLGNYNGHIRAKIYKESPGLKYWFNLKNKIFYPFDFYLDKITKVIVLVEGVADVLRLIYNRIPALATLGTMLPIELTVEYLKNLDVKKVIICYDGDKAGYDATFGNKTSKGLASNLEQQGFEVRVLRPPEIEGKDDPDTMPYLYINVLKKMVKSMGGELLNKLIYT